MKHFIDADWSPAAIAGAPYLERRSLSPTRVQGPSPMRWSGASAYGRGSRLMMPLAALRPPSTTLPARITAPVTGSVLPCVAGSCRGGLSTGGRVRAREAPAVPLPVVVAFAGVRLAVFGAAFFAVGRPAADFAPEDFF